MSDGSGLCHEHSNLVQPKSISLSLCSRNIVAQRSLAFDVAYHCDSSYPYGRYLSLELKMREYIEKAGISLSVLS